MKKKLKIKFWKAKKALAMQILEQEGFPKEKESGKVRIEYSPALFEEGSIVYLRGERIDYNYSVARIQFNTNEVRDEYLNEVVNAITDELFTSDGELKVGEICKVSNNENEDGSPNELIAILPKGYKERFIVKVFYGMGWDSFDYAHPLCKRIEPKIETNGEIITYTWEEE